MASHPQHYVVVWEWLTQPSTSRWKAYTPTVSQILEKAHRNKLTQVLLGDADPALSQLRVSLTSMVQICELKEEACPVRRMLYPKTSPAGQGIRWDWLGDKFAEWIEYEMDAQVAIETGWGMGLQTLDLSKQCPNMPYIINFCNLTQVRKDTGFVRSVRRVQQATYPVALRNEVPTEPVSLPISTKHETSEKSHGKHNWLAGIMNAVKSPNKQVTEPNKTPKHGRKTLEAAVSESKGTTKENNTQRGRRESRLALRVERRPQRSSSLDTVSTCLSQESIRQQTAPVATNNMV